MATMSILSTEGLSKSFGGIDAVYNMDFSVEEGEVMGIIGPNGAGKTTFVNLLCGRIQPDTGKVFYRRTDITRLPAWQRVRLGIAYTFQITSIYPKLSVFENVAIGAQMQVRLNTPHGRPKKLVADRIAAIAADCLKRTGMESYRSRNAGELAYGHQRLLEIAMGLALNPTLLILDEPTQGLSESEINEFATIIRQVRQQQTVILIEHNMPVVMSLVDRITVMDRGSILAQGLPAEIQQDERVKTAYLGG